ncbi:MAG: hypothetical protein ACXWTP_00340 [Methylosarcina sp.]
MNNLREAALLEAKPFPLNLREFMDDYGTNSLKELFVGVDLHQGNVTSISLPGDYNLTVSKSDGEYSLQVLSNNDSTGAKVDIPEGKVIDDKGEDKSEQAIKDIAQKVYEYFEKNAEDIKNGKIKAATIGGAIYGVAGGVILSILNPFALLGEYFDKVLTFIFTGVTKNVGEYYGSIVDDLVAFFKGEDKPRLTKIIGTLSALYFTVLIFDVPGGPLRVLGMDGWSLTKEIGEKVGGILEETVNEIQSITGIPTVDVVKEIEDAFNKIF